MFTADQIAGVARWPLVRVSARGETRVTLLSDHFLPLTVHWVGRSVVCAGDGCELCTVLPARGLFYLAVMNNDRPSILELASLSSSLLEQHCKLLHRGMRPGLVVRLYRRQGNQPVGSEVVDELQGVERVGQIVLAARVLALYHFPGPNPAETLEAYGARIASMAKVRAKTERRKWEGVTSVGVQGR